MNKITISLFGLKYEQRYYDINTLNSAQIQEWISSGKNKLEIDAIASQFQLLHTTQLFDPDKTWITIRQNDEKINIEPYLVSRDCSFNQVYGVIDASTYNDGIVVDSNCRVVATNPEQWHRDTQRIYDFYHEESYLSPLCSIILSGMQNSIPIDREYMINTVSSYSDYEYEFYISDSFSIDELGLIMDPYTNFYSYTDCMIPDFVLYDGIFRCGGEINTMQFQLDWAKCLVSKSMLVVPEYQFEDGKCNTSSSVLF